MAQYSVNNYTVENLLGFIKAGDIAIPEIQRPFVWDGSKVRDLLDSLYQGYPIGYIIVWQNPDVKLKDGTVSTGKKVLIDGQQRIMSLSAAIVGQEVTGEDYKKRRIIIAFNPQTEKFEVSNNALAKSPAWITDVADVFSPSFRRLSFLREYGSLNNLDDAQVDEIDAVITRLISIQNNSLGVIVLDQNLDIDKVTDIFIRINSKGVVLSQADFVMSKISANEEYGGNITRILQQHRDLFKRSGRSFGGKYKNVQNYINETHPDGTVITRFTPVAPHETPEAVEAICAAYAQAEAGERVDALILIPVFICDFLCIHPFNDGNGRMSRLLTLLLLYRSGYDVGKYISIEKQIEKTKDRYYETLEVADSGWHEAQNDPTPFIRYMLQVLLACYAEFEDRLGTVDNHGRSSTAYDTVKHYVLEKVGKFTSADVIAHCPSVGRSSALAALKQLTEEGTILRYGSGRSTFYIRAEE